MDTYKHTLGPWIVRDLPCTAHAQQIWATRDGIRTEMVAECGGRNQYANSELVAAAPRMLAALRAMRYAYGTDGTGTDRIAAHKEMIAAINAAEGR